jgi:hypothetical protein
MEVLLRSNVKRTDVKRLNVMRMNVKRRSASIEVSIVASMLTLLALGAACSNTSTPSNPDPPGSYIGTWSGSITSDVIGRGTATVVFDDGFKTSSVIQVTGHWSFEFADVRFNATGSVSGSSLPDASLFVMAFSGATVPCPAARDGVDFKGRSASVTLAGNRMQGSYIANGCPGGTIDLTKK